MTKPAITNRVTKGAALTYSELDTNFTNLQNATITVTSDTGSSIVNDLNGSFKISGGTALTSVGSGTQVTLNLDNTAVSPGSYTAATITVDQQGRITAASSNTLTTDRLTSNGYSLIYSDSGTIGTLTASHQLNIATASNGNIKLVPNGTGAVTIGPVEFPTTDGTNGQVLATNGTGSLDWIDAPSHVFTDTIATTTANTSGYWGQTFGLVGSEIRRMAVTAASGAVYIDLAAEPVNRLYFMIVFKTGGATVAFAQQGSWIGGQVLGSGQTGTFVYQLMRVNYGNLSGGWLITPLN